MDVPIRRLPLSHDVLTGFRVIAALPASEPVPNPLHASLTVCRMPDGRYVLCEMSGDVGAVIGQPMSADDAAELARAILARPSCEVAAPDLHGLAVALLGVLNDTFATRVADVKARNVFPLRALPAVRPAP